LLTVIVAVAVSPGVIVGVETAVETSAEAGPTFTVAEPVLFEGVGSPDDEVASVAPPRRLTDGVALAATTSGMTTDVAAPLSRVPSEHEMGPAAGPVQPAGRSATLTVAPTGGM
jgi:hypothetical protein